MNRLAFCLMLHCKSLHVVCASCMPWCSQQLCEHPHHLCSAQCPLCHVHVHPIGESLVPNVALAGLGCLLLEEESTMEWSHVGSIRDVRGRGTGTPGTEASCPSSLYNKSWLEKSCRGRIVPSFPALGTAEVAFPGPHQQTVSRSQHADLNKA